MEQLKTFVDVLTLGLVILWLVSVTWLIFDGLLE